MPAKLKIPDKMHWQNVRRLFQKIDSAQANIKFLISDIAELDEAAETALDG